MKRYKATREIVGHGVAISGQSSVLGSEMKKQRTILVGCLLRQVQKHSSVDFPWMRRFFLTKHVFRRIFTRYRNPLKIIVIKGSVSKNLRSWFFFKRSHSHICGQQTQPVW